MAAASIVLACLVPITAVAAELPGTGADAGKTVIYRDTWGVPHIYAPDGVAGLYAMGWAQAQDRPEWVLRNFKLALGEMAEVEGPDAVNSDIRVHMWDHYGVAQRNIDTLDPLIRRELQAFAAGINDYYAAHPEDVPDWWGERRVDEYMIIAFGRLFLYNWSIDDAYGDLRRAGIDPGFERELRGSNQWAVAPSRSAEGAAILLIDPHLSWFGPSRFWEVRIHAGDLVGSGFTLAGVPYIGLGHNAHVAWAMTTGGPDTADVYELTVREGSPPQYLYDGAWRDLTRREVEIRIRGEAPRTVPLWRSHHGPVIAFRGGKAYAAKTAYDEVGNLNEAWYRLNQARDYTGVVAALDTQTMFPQNVMAADTSGNIYYQRTGRVPKRPVGYDWSRPVDGSTRETEWTGIHSQRDLLQVLNPPQGYMQNCNIPPDAMMEHSPFQPEYIEPYIFSDRSHGPLGGWTNQRGARAVELLAQDDSVTTDEARAYAVDVQPFGVSRWMTALHSAHAAFGEKHSENPLYRAGIADIQAWDEQLERTSTGALKYVYWREQLAEDYGNGFANDLRQRIDSYYTVVFDGPVPPAQFSDPELEQLADAFAHAMARLETEFGLDAGYGDRYRVGRDDRSWPMGGGGGEQLGITTLRNISYSGPREDHTQWGRAGQTSTQIVVLTDPIQSWTQAPIGQSDRPDSPHYADQAEKLMSPRQFKPTWWRPEDLANHIASRTVLEAAP